jgi:hypothetical protein
MLSWLARDCCIGLTRKVGLSIRPEEPAARAQQLEAASLAADWNISAPGTALRLDHSLPSTSSSAFALPLLDHCGRLRHRGLTVS